jgi:aminopeptidase N
MPVKKVLRALLIVSLIAAAVPAFVAAQPAELLAKPAHFERSRDYDALHYRLVLVFDDKDKSYRGENTVTLASLKAGLAACALDAEGFTVTAAADAVGRPLAFAQSGKTLNVKLPAPLAYGETVSFTVSFFQKNPATGLKFVDASPRHPAQINTYSWPEDAHHWFPCFDDPVDKVTSEVIATVRGDFKVLSNGRLVGVVENKKAGTATWHWSQEKDQPVYGIVLAAGPFEVIQDRLDNLPVGYWVYPKDLADAPRSFRKTPRIIDFYAKTFGVPYPWAKYDQVCVAGYGGGFEATTATVLGDSTIHDERADQDFPSDGLVAHELAHMWWGDLVTERSWTDVWLSESFATYSDYLFTRFDRGEDEGALELERKKDAYLAEARDRYMRPIVFNHYDSPWDVMDAHSYPKGAAVLHMLRGILGDEAFFRTMGAFLKRFATKNADTHDFMTVVKDTTGENLDWFFEQWVLQPGHPVFDVASDWDGAAGRLRLRVRQVQNLSQGVPVFRVPVAIGIRTAEGPVSQTVWISQQDETFEFNVPSKPLLVRFDEGNVLLKELRFGKPVEELVYQLANDDVVGRAGAADALREFLAKPEALAALEKSAKSDPFWNVRRASVEALALAEVSPGLDSVFRDLMSDASSKVRAAAVRALGQRRDRRLAPFFEEVFRKDSSYVVQASALEALGGCGGHDRIPFLKRAAAMPSPHDVLRRSAEAALRMLETAASGKPKVLVRTEAGDIVVEVDAARAPITAANFLRYVDAGLYDGTTFFRTVTLDNQPTDKVRIEVIQGGQVGEAREFPPIAHETTRMTGLRHVDGAVSMARAKPGSAASSFFICVNDQPELDFGGRRNPDGQGFAAFGRVVAGMDVVRRIQAMPAEGQLLKPPVKILSVKRTGK